LKRLIAVLLPLAAFGSLETIIALLSAVFLGGASQHAPLGPFAFLWVYAPPLSITTWAVVVVTAVYSRSGRSIFARKGFEDDVYRLMVKMRGSGSRLTLLKSIEEPRHRLELAEITGIDWKEVDRQLKVLENYGLARVTAHSGSIKLYQITEQGRLLLKLIDDLSHTDSVQ
jgi:DNA-binding HxlR family transcriptional regulator